MSGIGGGPNYQVSMSPSFPPGYGSGAQALNPTASQPVDLSNFSCGYYNFPQGGKKQPVKKTKKNPPSKKLKKD